MTREKKKIDGLLKEYIEKWISIRRRKDWNRQSAWRKRHFTKAAGSSRLLIWNFYSGRQRISVNDGGFSSF